MSTDYLSCKQAAHLLDVSPSTIKRLCDEGRLESLRTPGGHRRISFKSVQQCLESVGITEPHERASKRESNVALDYHEFAHKLINGDDHELTNLIARYSQRNSVIDLCDLVFAPAMVHLSASQLRNELRLSQVTVAIQRLRGVLYGLRYVQPALGVNAPVAVGAHVAGDPSDIASLMIELALRELGWRAQSLGSNVDGHTLGEAATAVGASIIWVCYVHQQPQDDIVEQNQLLRKHMPAHARLIIGGGALTAQLRRLLSFHFFGDSLAQMRDYICATANAHVA